MKRRDFCVALPAAALGFSLSGCNREPSTGPADIKWDRDVDPRCSMVIGDKRFAAQIRDPNRKVTKFDDIGCAMFWLMQQPFGEQTPNTEYWVADYRKGGWLDARNAHYLEGKKSPMGYHFAAVSEPEAGTIPYQEMKKRILSRGK
ncbi:MAG: protein NosL [Betaproteobacteria bacterium]|nr:protein NosL [Betaproteobacteria bacterium]